MSDGMIFLSVAGIILFVIYLYKWYPEKHEKKMKLFLASIDNLYSGMDLTSVIVSLPYKPTARYQDLLVYDITKMTSASVSGGRASYERTSIYFEISFENNVIKEIHYARGGKLALYKSFKI